jgi:peptidyl-tRNA hydrolase, PTH1 family
MIQTEVSGDGRLSRMETRYGSEPFREDLSVDLFFKKMTPKSEPGLTYLLVGFGNPGREYRANRHNAGFMVIDRLCEDLSIQLSRMQSKALVGTGNLTVSAREGGEPETRRVILAKPQTYMNLSGQSVSGLVHFYKVPVERLLIIHDDMDIPFGTLRMRPGGGAGGQKGLKSTIEQLGTQNFPRLRVGIGRPPGQMAPPDYVLQDFPKGDQEALRSVLDRAAQAGKVFVSEGLEQAMNQFNGALQEE